VDEEIRAYYETGIERNRLTLGYSRIEFERTKELLERHLPRPPARLLDVGGGPGVYADWLAGLGYEVRLLDPSPLHVSQAIERSGGRFTAAEGDARDLDEEDASYDAVLLLGPLYHLTERADRLAALREARRVLRPGGLCFAAAVSRFASLLSGLFDDLLGDPEFGRIVERDLRDGQHRNPTPRDYFTTAFFHHPDELAAEVREAGFALVDLVGIEGPGWPLPDVEKRWADPVQRDQLLWAARVVEREPSLLGFSAHLLAVARRA
jgi:SAM-dependent methyltransferase